MPKSLKEKNRSQLIVFAILNAAVVAVLLAGITQVLSLLGRVTKGDLGVLGKLVALPAALAVIIGILGWAVPKSWKEAMIFWRIRDCLPSSRAFTVIAFSDPRVDRPRLAERYGELPSKSSEQTALWYRLYKKNAEQPAVEDAHGAYLRYREMAALTASVMVAFLVASRWTHASLHLESVGVILILGEFLLVVSAARNSATHLVANVLAIEAAAES